LPVARKINKKSPNVGAFFILLPHCKKGTFCPERTEHTALISKREPARKVNAPQSGKAHSV
jgi:hypothetical protein